MHSKDRYFNASLRRVKYTRLPRNVSITPNTMPSTPLRHDAMERPAKKCRIRISSSVSQFPGTKKAVQESYVELETAYQRVKIAQLIVKYRELEHLGQRAIELVPGFEHVAVSTKVDEARAALRSADAAFEDALQQYCAVWCARIGTLLLTLPVELRDSISRSLVLVRHPLDSEDVYNNIDPSLTDQRDAITTIPHYYALLGLPTSQEVAAELLRVSHFERAIWLVVQWWSASTAALKGPENLTDVRRRMTKGVARLRAFLDPTVLAAARTARARDSSIRVVARVHSHDVQFLLDALAPVALLMRDSCVKAVASLYVGAAEVEPTVFMLDEEAGRLVKARDDRSSV
ncbi:hypothetical protein PSPO01_13045 [Paraphaeosphaeria sporulosa]